MTLCLILSLVSLLVSLFVIIFTFKKIELLLINLHRMSKGMDILFANQEKILELTKIKGFVSLMSEEESSILVELRKERSKQTSLSKTIPK